MKATRSIGALAALGGLLAASLPAPAQTPVYQDPNQPLARRVDDLVRRMTLEEKVSQMMTDAAAIPRLGVPEYHWWSECLHGDASSPATVFPEPIGLAATWDIPMESKIATAISDEDRATYAVSTAKAGSPQPFRGLTFFAPNINIFRDPRWGRGQETYGEDPYLTARFGVAYIKGLQGDDPHYLKVVATPKHYAVHSGPELERHRFDAVVSNHDLYDTYLPAFEASIREGKAYSIMGAYSALDGIPDCASPLLLQDNLRQKWGFDGYVVSDCGAIGDINGGHQYVKTPEAAAAVAVKAGCDLTCGGEYAALPNAVKQGLITEAEIDRSVKRLFTARFKLGMFDPPARVPYTRIPASVIDSPQHRQLALQAARECLVLLKNDGDALPLSPSIKSLAVIGPNADSVPALYGNYNGSSSHATTILQGIQSRAARAGVRVEYAQGVGLTQASDVSPVPASALRSGGQPGLTGEYFSNENLDGTPAVTRRDDQVRFAWTGNSPARGLGQYHYSVRWTGELVAPQDGEYTLGARSDDGFRLYVNGEKVLDDWGVHPAQTKTYTVTLKAGQAVPIRLEYFQGEGEAEIALLWKEPGGSLYADALAAARHADAVVYVGGITSQIEGEEGTNGNGDRTDIALPKVQEDLLEALSATGKPIIFVLMSGSAMGVTWAKDHVPAILQAWYPGEEGGTAVAGALFGDDSPAGRLPVTFYQSVDQLPPFRDYAMKGRTYRYFTGEPLYSFGYGLSYTRFAYSGLNVARRGDARTVTAQVQNIGKHAGDEVVEVYTKHVDAGPDEPRLQLAGFQRVHLDPGQKKSVTISLAPEAFSVVGADGARTIPAGRWQVFVGGGQPSLSGAPGALSATVQVQ